MFKRLSLVLLASLTTFIVLPTPAAQAGTWGAYPTSTGKRTCSSTRVWNGAAHQVCLEFNSARIQVRAIAFINPSAYTNFQVNMRLWFGNDGVSVPQSCPTMTGNSPRACWTGWTTLRLPYVVADATFGIAGQWMLPLRALDMKLSAKIQETSTYCGPAAVQTVLATIGASAPSQSVLADRMATDTFGLTLPGALSPAINAYAGAPDYRGQYQSSTPEGLDAGMREIVESLSRGRPAIVLVRAGSLPWSNASPYYRHYVVIHGYGGWQHPDVGYVPTNFNVLDPWDGVEHQISIDDLMTATHLAVSDGEYFVART
ncbi:C39 family peptidase [Micromonospora sp. KC723]|uniref:C39 family peptidase n=1 Tax=Micromonospora sp. KC723 TaxID=2530381 RepID=UPI001042A90D|nr:C39 family peptidase [Micromonospora sp. KC723]TDB72830.1 hypothetical protein E1165_19115 [Micromonospora sp. KC723]